MPLNPAARPGPPHFPTRPAPPPPHRPTPRPSTAQTAPRPDRSLANVVAHEVAHSWTGNLITNHTWEHFWLNEGWTVWLERKIKASMAADEALVTTRTRSTPMGARALLQPHSQKMRRRPRCRRPASRPT